MIIIVYEKNYEKLSLLKRLNEKPMRKTTSNKF